MKKLESGVCIPQQYNEMQDGNGADETTNAECFKCRYHGMIQPAASYRKRVGEENTVVRKNGVRAERLPIPRRSFLVCFLSMRCDFGMLPNMPLKWRRGKQNYLSPYF